MLFVIIGHDAPGAAEARPLHRDKHLAHVRPLDEQGRVVIAGPFTDHTGSLLIIDFDSQDDAETFARTDPYTMHGIFARVEVKPFKQVFPEK